MPARLPPSAGRGAGVATSKPREGGVLSAPCRPLEGGKSKCEAVHGGTFLCGRGRGQGRRSLQPRLPIASLRWRPKHAPPAPMPSAGGAGVVVQLVLESPQLRNAVICDTGVGPARGQEDTVRRREGPGVSVAGRSVEGSPAPYPQIRAGGRLIFLYHVSRLHGGLGGKTSEEEAWAGRAARGQQRELFCPRLCGVRGVALGRFSGWSGAGCWVPAPRWVSLEPGWDTTRRPSNQVLVSR